MEESLFKVYFNRLSEELDQNYHLTFISLQEFNLSFSAFPTFLLKFNEQSRKRITHSIQKIKQIIPFGGANYDEITQSYVILFSQHTESNLQRKGYLLGKDKQQTYHILGCWPYFLKTEIFTQPAVISKELAHLVNNPTDFHKIIMITE